MIQNLSTPNASRQIFKKTKNKNNMQKFTAEVELTPTMPSRMSEKNSLDRKIHYLQSKKSEEYWSMTSYVNFLGW